MLIDRQTLGQLGQITQQPAAALPPAPPLAPPPTPWYKRPETLLVLAGLGFVVALGFLPKRSGDVERIDRQIAALRARGLRLREKIDAASERTAASWRGDEGIARYRADAVRELEALDAEIEELRFLREGLLSE